MVEFEPCFGFGAPTAPAYGEIPTASSHVVANLSPRVSFRTSPYDGSSRGRSRSDGLLSVSRTQHQSHLINSNINMPAPATHSSPELTSSTAKIDVDSFSELQTGFDSSSFDFAMAFTEASYPAQISADTTSPTLQADLRATTQPSISPNGHRGPFPPDLFAPLKTYSLNPPPSDEARRQSLRFPTDLYTP